MVSTLIENRLNSKSIKTDLQRINIAKEIVQEVALLALHRRGFFNQVAFQGGTALRLFHGLDRFSEDLDFALIKPDDQYSLEPVLETISEEFAHWGLSVEVKHRSSNTNVKKAFFKENSLGAHLNLDLPLSVGQKLKVKIELDINPPSNAKLESKLCQFPTDFYVTCYTPETLFAGKLHALLCRKYGKGRDWYDLTNYISKGTKINLLFLEKAFEQIGPWDSRKIPQKLTITWIKEALEARIQQLSIRELIDDVQQFVIEQEKLQLWSIKYFLDKIELMKNGDSA